MPRFSIESRLLQPKHVVLEVFGPPRTVATITYLEVNAQPQRVDDGTLPWSDRTTNTLNAFTYCLDKSG